MARGAVSNADFVKKVGENFVPVLIDFDSEKDWVKKHSVAMIPALIWADSDGEMIERSLETSTAEELILDLEDALAGLLEDQEQEKEAGADDM